MNNRIIAYAAFGVLAFLWLAFFSAMLLNPGMLNAAWQSFLGWPLIVQLVVGLLTLFKLLEEGKIKPVITGRFPILEAARANALLESG